MMVLLEKRERELAKIWVINVKWKEENEKRWNQQKTGDWRDWEKERTDSAAAASEGDIVEEMTVSHYSKTANEHRKEDQ